MSAFLAMKEKIGLYPIVDHAEWVEKLLTWGIRTIQLRIKDQPIDIITENIINSINIAKKYDAQLFINDYWQLAIQYGAFGVHLGQEDIVDANVVAIKKAGLRLGVSTHSDVEIKKALDYQPSYIAFGPIYHTNTKQMPYSPQGLERLKACCQWSKVPVVAIGGINRSRVKGILTTGVDGVAILSAIVASAEPAAEVKALLESIG
jgi:thiamine-phosphate diphosphorylase